MHSAPAELLGPQPPAGRPGDPPPAPPHDPPPTEIGSHPPGPPPCEPGALHRVELGCCPHLCSPPLSPPPRALLSRVPAFKPSSLPEPSEWEAAAGVLPHKESANTFGVGELEDTEQEMKSDRGSHASVGRRVAGEGHHQAAHP